MQIISLRPIKGVLTLCDFSCDCELIYIGGTLVCRFNNLNLPPAIEFSHQPVRSQSQYHYIKACLGMSAEPSQMWNQVIKFLQWVGVKKKRKRKKKSKLQRTAVRASIYKWRRHRANLKLLTSGQSGKLLQGHFDVSVRSLQNHPGKHGSSAAAWLVLFKVYHKKFFKKKSKILGINEIEERV